MISMFDQLENTSLFKLLVSRVFKDRQQYQRVYIPRLQMCNCFWRFISERTRVVFI